VSNGHKASQHRVVIAGGGFGGLYAANRLEHADVDVTVVDRRNFHLFQPLLYQVATGGLSPADISSPLRATLRKHGNTRVWQAEATGLDAARRVLILRDGELPYDPLIVATGLPHAYFGNDQWAERAPGLKTVEDALEIRRRIFLAFETAERETDAEKRMALMTFVVVGGGPTGVELAGAIGELANSTLKNDFRSIDSRDASVLLVEGVDRVLPGYPPRLSERARHSLEGLGVKVRTDTRVSGIDADTVTLRTSDGEEERIAARTVLWAAGVKASSLAQILEHEAGARLDKVGRVFVEPDLSIKGHDEILVIGDLAHFAHQNDEPLPGVAQVAMQQGRYAADLIQSRLAGRTISPFCYRDKGNLAVIGRNAAVADLPWARLTGRIAWLTWVFVHIFYLIEFDNRVKVLFEWASDYFTRKRGARLITGRNPQPLVASRRKPEGEHE